MVITLTASIIETVVVKTTVFATTQAVNLLYYGGSSLWSWYYPTISETEKLNLEIKRLRGEINDLKEYEYNKLENTVIALNDNQSFDEIEIN